MRVDLSREERNELSVALDRLFDSPQASQGDAAILQRMEKAGIDRERTIVAIKGPGEITECFAHDARAELKLRFVGVPGQQVLAARKRFGGPPRVAQHCDRGLRRLEVSRVERDGAIECGQRGFEIAESMAAGAEQEPGSSVVWISLAGGLEQPRRFLEPAGLEQAYGFDVLFGHESGRAQITSFESESADLPQ